MAAQPSKRPTAKPCVSERGSASSAPRQARCQSSGSRNCRSTRAGRRGPRRQRRQLPNWRAHRQDAPARGSNLANQSINTEKRRPEWALRSTNSACPVWIDLGPPGRPVDGPSWRFRPVDGPPITANECPGAAGTPARGSGPRSAPRWASLPLHRFGKRASLWASRSEEASRRDSHRRWEAAARPPALPGAGRRAPIQEGRP